MIFKTLNSDANPSPRPPTAEEAGDLAAACGGEAAIKLQRARGTTTDSRTAEAMAEEEAIEREGMKSKSSREVREWIESERERTVV